MIKQLLEQYLSEALTEENIDSLSKVLQESFEAKVLENRDAVRLELTAQFVADREALVESVDTMVKELVAEHMEELKDDIENFRDLEVEYANRLAEAKNEMAIVVEKDMKNLVESLDAYVEERISSEVEELKESINEQRKNQLGLQIFEHFRPAVQALMDKENGNEEIRKQLEEAHKQLEAQSKLIAESSQALAESVRTNKLSAVLAPLHGRPKEIMESILINVPTDKLEEVYENFIPHVLNEVSKHSEKDGATQKAESSSKVLAEGKNEESLKNDTVVITGDDKEKAALLESLDKAPSQYGQSIDDLRNLAGLTGY